MEHDISDGIHAILTYGMQLKDRLASGETCSLQMEQETLRRMLSEPTSDSFEFAGDTQAEVGNGASHSLSAWSDKPGRFLGIRYALVSWLDEIFILDSPWGTQWNEQKLEVALYGSNDRAWKFWEQARLAESRESGESLKAFFLCVMLGFRGELRHESGQLQAWVAKVRGRILKDRQKPWTAPPQLQPATHVPLLRGREAMQRMVLASGAMLLLLLPVVAFLVVYQLSR